MKQSRIMSLDILKGLAMLMVIIVHFNQSFSCHIRFFEFFQMGCQIFFVASGFGVGFSFAKKLKDNSLKQATKSFYRSRLQAIAPAWWFMILFVFLANTVFRALTGSLMSFGDNRSILGILGNIFFLNGVIPSCNNNVVFGGWYIGTTMLLYLITPILFALYEKFPRKRKLIALLTCCAGYALFACLIIAYIFLRPDDIYSIYTNNGFGYFSVLIQYPCFCLGTLLYYDYREDKIGKHGWGNLLLGLVFLSASVGLFFFNPEPYSSLNPLKYSCHACAALVGLAAFFIIRAMICFEKKHTISKVFTPLIKLGSNSLYVYLVHCFFVLEKPLLHYAKNGMKRCGISGEGYPSYFILLPCAVILSYLGGMLLKTVTKFLFDVFSGITGKKEKIS